MAKAVSGPVHVARAKINLDLLITGRREDGFHLLDSLVVFADYGDEIMVSSSDRLELEISGPFATSLHDGADNLVHRAADVMRRRFNVRQGARVHLIKNLPVASGIGGGSADAAATIRALLDFWDIADDRMERRELALSLGADVPVCLLSRTAHMTGVGEGLRPVTLDFPLHLILVNPGVGVSTAEIFARRAARQAAFSPGRHMPDHLESPDHLLEILAAGNDLLEDACGLAPEVASVLDHIRASESCIFANMSGSGATCYGIFPSAVCASRAAERLSRSFPDWWVRDVGIR